MSAESVEIVRAYLRALAEDGLVATAKFWDPDISWRAIEGAPDAVGEMVGTAAVLRYLKDWVDMFDDITNVPVELMDIGDDRVVAVQHSDREQALEAVGPPN